MPELQFPLSTAPGVNIGESGGRLVNAFVEKAAVGSRSKTIWRRVPGLLAKFSTIETEPRGALLVGSVLYVVSGDKAYSITSSLVVTELSGDAIGGAGRVTMDRNMNATPQVLIEHTGGMSQINTGAGTVTDFSDGDLPSINSLCFVGGYFVTSAANGQMNSSGLNAVTFGANDKATAEQSPDGLVRVIRYGRDLAAMGNQTIEFWGNVGTAGFPFSFSSVIPVGLLSKFAVAGFELGFTGPVCFVASDRTVQRLVGYAAEKISTPDLDALLAQVADVSDLEMSVYVEAGHACTVLSSDTWTWVFDHSTGQWHERASFGQTRWRASLGVNAFDQWFTFDGAQAFKIDRATRREGADALVWEVHSAQVHAFPSRIEINRASFDFLTGVGNDAGAGVIETNPRVLIDYSDDGGFTWSTVEEFPLGTQGERVTVDCWLQGTTGNRGRQYRLKVSDPVEVALMGGAWDGRVVE